MLSMREIRQRIISVKDIQHITRAMKMVSVAKLHRTEAAWRRAREYRESLEAIFNFVLKKPHRFRHPFFEKRKSGPSMIIAIASDKGLCSGYNSSVIKKVGALLEKEAGLGQVMMIGRRAINLARARGIRLTKEYAGYSSKPDVRYAAHLAREAIELYRGGKIARTIVVLVPYKRPGVRGACVNKLLPMEEPKEKKESLPADYFYEPSSSEVVERLLESTIESRLFDMLIEAQLSEHVSRMQAMENATKNAGDLIAELTLSYNKARQTSITAEILDIMGGAEALT